VKRGARGSCATQGQVPISSWAASLQQPRDPAVASWPCDHFLALAVGACRSDCCSTAKRAPPKKPRAPPKKRTADGPAPGEREETRHRAMHSPILAAHAAAVERRGAADAHVPPAVTPAVATLEQGLPDAAPAATAPAATAPAATARRFGEPSWNTRDEGRREAFRKAAAPGAPRLA